MVVREPISRNSADLPAALRDSLEKTPVGRTTRPERTREGLELIAVCGKKETQGDTSARKELRDQIAAEQLDGEAQRYLQQLRQSAAIDIRQK